MGELAGPFHFKGQMETTLAQHVAEQLNALNGNGLHPDVMWTTGPDGVGVCTLCSRTDDLSDAKSVGRILHAAGILRNYGIYLMPGPQNPAPGQGPYYLISVDLADIDREQLEDELINATTAEELAELLEDEEEIGMMPYGLKGPVFN